MRANATRYASALLWLFAAAVMLVVLNAALALHLWAPQGEPLRALVPVPESFAVLLLACLVARRVRRLRVRRVLSVGLGALVGILSGVSAAEGFFRFYYARSFAPRGDTAMIRGALLLFLGDIGPVVDVLAPVTFVILVLALSAAGWLWVLGASALLSRLDRAADRVAVVAAVALFVAVLTGWAQSVTVVTTASWRNERRTGFDDIVIVSGSGSAGAVRGESGTDAVRADDPASDPAHDVGPSYRFPGLRDRDIHVFVVEAYGYASIYRPELAEHLDPVRDRLVAAFRRHGYDVVTDYLRSPVAGGYSWLAEATLLTGQWVDSQERFLRLADAVLPTLTGTFQDAGYYTLTIRPGTVHGPWPEGWDLYRFEETIIAHGGAFGFEGPWFSYVPVTDQFAIWTGHRRIEEITEAGGAAEERPLLAYYQLVSSHTPFNSIPPVIEDWEELGDGSIYHERADEILRFNNTWTGGTQLIEGYIASITYVFDVLTDYVDRIMDHGRDPIIIILGDHEPQRPIRSTQSVLSVPVHVASRDQDILGCFVDRGYESGMRGGQLPPHDPMTSFFPMVIDLALNCH